MKTIKICNLCEKSKEIDQFYKRKNRFMTQCKDCIKEKSKKWVQNNKEKHKENCKKWIKKNYLRYQETNRRYYRDNIKHIKTVYRKYKLKSQYNMTPEQYDEMFNNQEGKCLICKRPEIEFKKGLEIDHCHVTGKVRGLLCMDCNTGLGKFKDNITLLQKAIEYLNHNKIEEIIYKQGQKAVIKELIEDLSKIPLDQATGDFLKGQSYAYKAVLKTLEKLSND